MAWLDELRTGFFRRRAVAVVVVFGVAAVDNFCQIRVAKDVSFEADVGAVVETQVDALLAAKCCQIRTRYLQLLG